MQQTQAPAGPVASVPQALVLGKYAETVMTDGPAGYWRLGDTDTTAVDDAAGRDGRYTSTNPTTTPPALLAYRGQPGAIAGDDDTAAFFHVHNIHGLWPVTQHNWVTVPDDPDLAPPQVSVEAWITMKPNTPPQTYSSPAMKGNGVFLDGYGLYYYSNYLYFYVNTRMWRIGVPVTPSFFSGYRHVVGTYDGTDLKIYLDGEFVDALRMPNASTASSAPFTIGKGPYQGWSGHVDEVAMYPYALSDEQIRHHHRVGAGKVIEWGEAAVVLDAWKDLRTGQDHVATRTLPQPTRIRVPQFVAVTTGNAGNGQLDLTLRTPGGTDVLCRYRGRSPVPHPTEPIDVNRGRRYELIDCSNGWTFDDVVEIVGATARVVSGDLQHPSGKIGVVIHLGAVAADDTVAGCSDTIPPPIAPEEVAAMRQEFRWQDAKSLPETDPDGNHAIWHGMIYVTNEHHIELLNRFKIYYSTSPISAAYREGLKGKCGKVGQATDGVGTIVYALFPARFYNIMRDFGAQTETANVTMAPPFGMILPSTPDIPEYVNSDGSIKYSALRSSGYLEWLQSRSAQEPFLDDVFDAIGYVISGGPIVDIAVAVFDPQGGLISTGVSYVAGGAESAVDWAANVVDDIWEGIQVGLQEIILIWEDKITVNAQVFTINRDPLFNNDIVRRSWGPLRADGRGAPVFLQGARLRIKQWGYGFLPLMDQEQLDAEGRANGLEAVEGASGRDGDLCIELDTEWGIVTSDIIADEVCDFGTGRLTFEEDVPNLILKIASKDVFAFTVAKDARDYSINVMGYEPHRVEILVGGMANRITGALNDGAAMAPCLGFPGVSTGLLQAVPFIDKMLLNDIYWPDANGANGPDSRGIMTHEYGHFNMCSIMFRANGVEALNGLIPRITMDDDRDEELPVMLESIADLFSMQVLGATNYVDLPPNIKPPPPPPLPQLNPEPDAPVISKSMSYCVHRPGFGQSPCLDANFVGANDAGQTSEFKDEIAKWTSVFHDAFDSSNPDDWRTNRAPNGDFWRQFFKVSNGATMTTVAPAAESFVALDDEPVSLPASAWQEWILRWGESTPDKGVVLKALANTMQSHGASWCDACEVMAVHDIGVPPIHRAVSASRTPGVRASRWKVCAEKDLLQGWAAPEEFGNMDAATCTACPSRHRTDPATGQCVPCPVDTVARGGACETCPPGHVPNGNECVACGPNQITVNGQCNTCPTAKQPNFTQTQCVDCLMDRTLDWSTVPQECTEEVSVTISSTPDGTAVDECPDEFWIWVRNIDVIDGRGSNALEFVVDPMPSSTNQPICESASVSQTTFASLPPDPGLFVISADSDAPGQFCQSTPPILCFDDCPLHSDGHIPITTIRSGINEAKIKVSAQSAAGLMQGVVRFTSVNARDSSCTGGGGGG